MKIFSGKVISLKNKDTATVEVERFLSHPVYKKRFKRTKKYQVHTAKKDLKIGQTIKFAAVAPISKTKKWAVKEGK